MQIRRVGKAKRAHLSCTVQAKVGTALVRLCPPYYFPAYAFTAAFGQYLSRRWRFTSLRVGVRGSSASKSMLRGHSQHENGEQEANFLLASRHQLFLFSYSLSTMVTFAMPPPSHMVCRP
jgi:hypothetical protein